MDNTKALLACLKPVDSSMFSKAGYSEDFWTLVLVFKSTREIKGYKNVSPEVADEALTAKSLGTWWNQHVKGNPHFGESETIGTDEPERPAPKLDEQCGLSDEELDMIAPGPDAPKIEFQVQSPGPPPRDGFDAEIIQELPIEEVQRRYPDSAIATLPPAGELLGAWTAPESAAEALDLLAEREGEIKAIIAQNAQTGAQALTVKVTSPESRADASETLNKLVTKRDKTFAALDPFRAVLHSAYKEAGDKVSSAVDPLKKGIDFIKSQCLSWDQQVERQRQEALRREALEREAEARRQQGAESQRITLAAVEERIQQGDDAGAQLLFDSPIEAPKPYIAPRAEVIPPPPPKVEGQSTATTWKVDRDAIESDPTGAAYLTSITVLLRAVKDGSFPVEQAAPLLSWDFGKADKLASAMMSAFNIPGLSVKPVSTMRVGSGRGKKGRG